MQYVEGKKREKSMNAYLHKCLLRCILQLHAEISPSIINFILQVSAFQIVQSVYMLRLCSSPILSYNHTSVFCNVPFLFSTLKTTITKSLLKPVRITRSKQPNC